MSFGLPSIVPKPTVSDEFNIHNDNYGVPNPMVSGLSATRQSIGYSHPIEASERNYQQNRDRMNMILLRNTQGIHAPMRLAMELKATESIGRLPFLPSSNMMRDVLLGRDEEIGFEDVLNTPEFREQMGQPHAVIEKSLGIL
ncbi:proteasome maturation protein [Hylaeus anthracinus]|uniref:proteasome maturation protein n=1 Tax=Hylaeus volcanicus TaxID=313075 RepID=UPI0023B7BE08|nr:proteasome maturation protein [Hylaeus volcanicus]XP_054004310.1 proteasome maturation protein [Hylaeus anthracinus]